MKRFFPDELIRALQAIYWLAKLGSLIHQLTHE